MNWKIAATVLVKELRETLRDRRSLVIIIVIPALLYPALFVLTQQLALFGQRSMEAAAMRVAVVGALPDAFPLHSDSEMVVVRSEHVPLQELQAGKVAAVVVFEGGNGADSGTDRLRIMYDGSRDQSTYARAVIQAKASAWGDSLLARRLDERGLPRSFGQPLAVRDTSVASARRLGGYTLGRFLPMILIMMTVLGAFYPAIDLAAGEKERGTLEPLLTVPVRAGEIVAGKFAAVTVIALAAATLNLVSILLTFQVGVAQMSGMVDLRFDLPLRAMVLIFLVLALLAVLFASLFLGIAVRSRSFREAQNSLTPVYTVAILPALLVMMPGVEFSLGIALVPIAGVAMLFRALATGEAPLLPVVAAIAATLCYATAALAFAVRAFGREEVLFGNAGGTVTTGSLSSRLRSWRTSAGRAPSARAALMFAVGVALLTFYGGVPLQGWWGERGLLLSQLLLIGLPAVLFAMLGPFDVRRTLALQPVAPRGLLAAALILAGGLPLGWLLGWLQSMVLELPVEFLETMRSVLTAGDPWRLAWLILVIALVPAVCEELAFRGVLLQGLGREMTMWRAVLLSAVIFGVFHLSFQTVIRFLPTFWMGLLLGYVVWHTRSIFASMLMHFANNAFAVLLVSSASMRAFIVSPTGEPRWLLVVLGLLLLAAGIRLLPKRATEAEEPATRAPVASPVPAMSSV
ncbi:ABC transporter permease [soil metagenome]